MSLDVRVELSEIGARLVKSGWMEIRGNARAQSGQHWSVRLQLTEVEGELLGEASFLVPEVERQFTREFELRQGVMLVARCIPVHGHD